MTDTDTGATEGGSGLGRRVVSRRNLLKGATAAGVGTGLAMLAPGAFAAGASKFPIGAAAKSKSKPVSVTMWHSMTSANLAALTALTNQFNASQTDVSVNLVAQTSYTDTLTAYTTALSGGLSRLPDLVQWETELIQVLIDSQSVIPVGSAITADHYSLSDYVPSMVNFFRVDGTLWALPFNVSSQVLYYDQNALTKAGLDPANPPVNLAQLPRSGAEDRLKRHRKVRHESERDRLDLRAVDGARWPGGTEQEQREVWTGQRGHLRQRCRKIDLHLVEQHARCSFGPSDFVDGLRQPPRHWVRDRTNDPRHVSFAGDDPAGTERRPVCQREAWRRPDTVALV